MISVYSDDNKQLFYSNEDQVLIYMEKGYQVTFPRNNVQRVDHTFLRPGVWKTNFYNKQDVVLCSINVEDQVEINKLMQKLLSKDVNLFGYMKRGK